MQSVGSEERPPKSSPPSGLSKRLYRVRDAAEYLGISTTSVRQLVRDGEIAIVPGPRINSPWLFDRRDLDRWVDGRKIAYPRKTS